MSDSLPSLKMLWYMWRAPCKTTYPWAGQAVFPWDITPIGRDFRV